MRTTEGKGLVAPAPVRIRLDDSDRAYVAELTAKRLGFRRYGDRLDEWGRGLCGTEKAVLVGFACEVAFARWVRKTVGVHLNVDDADRPRGDGGVDFLLANYRIQVKGATADYDDLLVRTTEFALPADAPCFAPWDIVVRAHYPSRNGREPSGGLFDVGERADWYACDLCGWIWSQHFLRYASIESARRGAHWNYVLPPTRFLPMKDLAAVCEARLNAIQRTP